VSDIDERLKANIFTELRQYATDAKYSDSEVQAASWALERIVQTFKEAGYAKVTKEPYRDELGRRYTMHIISYPDGSGYFVKEPLFAITTGQEFCDRFKDEATKLHPDEAKLGSVLRVAEIAAGIKETPVTHEETVEAYRSGTNWQGPEIIQTYRMLTPEFQPVLDYDKPPKERFGEPVSIEEEKEAK
jgi:hypothetical protein